MFDPKYPESFFEAYNQLHNRANKMQKELAEESQNSKKDTFKIFEDIQTDQTNLAHSQSDLHNDVMGIECNWAQASTVSASHKQYKKAINFFNIKEDEINNITQDMHELADKITNI